MSKKQDKKSVINTIQQAATQYKNSLVGKTFLYVFDGRFITVLFKVKDFLHLTGVDTKMGAKEFYTEALRGTLSPNQIFFSQRHPYDLCKRKIKPLLHLSDVTKSDVIVIENITTESFTYKFGLTDLSAALCLANDTDKNGNIMSKYYVARSIRSNDCLDKAEDIFDVQYIFSKRNDEKLYNKILYKAENVSINDLPQSVLNMIDKSILDLD